MCPVTWTGEHGRMTEEEHASSRQSAPRGTTPSIRAGRGAGRSREPPGAAATGPTAPGGTRARTGRPGRRRAVPRSRPAAVARRLTRSRRPKVVGGVCAGLGRYFDLDPVIFRVPLAVLSVVGGLGLVFYGGRLAAHPRRGRTAERGALAALGPGRGHDAAAILVALVGCGLFLASLGNRSAPFSLLIAGAVVGAAYWSQHRRAAEAAEAVGVPVDPDDGARRRRRAAGGAGPARSGHALVVARAPHEGRGARHGIPVGPGGSGAARQGEGPAGPGSRAAPAAVRAGAPRAFVRRSGGDAGVGGRPGGDGGRLGLTPSGREPHGGAGLCARRVRDRARRQRLRGQGRLRHHLPGDRHSRDAGRRLG